MKTHPTGPGRVWQKDIDYTTPGKPCKDVGLNTKHTKKATGNPLNEKCSVPDRPWNWD